MPGFLDKLRNYFKPPFTWQITANSVTGVALEQNEDCALAPAATDFAVGARTTVMEWPYVSDGEGREFDIAPDGQRFIAIKRASEEEVPKATLILTQN